MDNQQRLEVSAGILATAVRIEDHPRDRPLKFNPHTQDVDDQVPTDRLPNRPTPGNTDPKLWPDTAALGSQSTVMSDAHT